MSIGVETLTRLKDDLTEPDRKKTGSDFQPNPVDATKFKQLAPDQAQKILDQMERLNQPGSSLIGPYDYYINYLRSVINIYQTLETGDSEKQQALLNLINEQYRNNPTTNSDLSSGQSNMILDAGFTSEPVPGQNVHDALALRSQYETLPITSQLELYAIAYTTHAYDTLVHCDNFADEPEQIKKLLENWQIDSMDRNPDVLKNSGV